jgi:hypothetical protein
MQELTSNHSESQIIEIEERLRQAMLKSDVSELNALIAPELIFTNYLGHLVSKQEDLNIHQSGILNFTELTPSDRHIQINPGFSVVSIKIHIIGTYDGAQINQHCRFTRVWAISSTGTLQIIAGHVGLVSE